MKHTDVVRLLLARGASAAAAADDGETPLHAAVGFGCTQRGRRISDDSETIVKVLLEHHAVIDAQDSAGDTPLIIAARAGLTEVVRYLLASGAGTHYRDKSGKSALDYAEANHHEEVSTLLREPRNASNQAMQPTASKPDVYAWSVCHRARILRGMQIGLAAADLVSR
jgi:ankyrin repeat protein